MKQWMGMNRVMAAALGALIAAGVPTGMTAPASAQDSETTSRTGTGTPLGAPMTGTTQRGANAGKIEASLLSGLVVKHAARKIVDATGTDFSSLTMVVLPVPLEAENGSTMVGGKGWDVLEGADKLPVVDDLVRVRDGLTSFGQRHAALAALGNRSCSTVMETKSFDKGITSSINSVTNILDAATPILNLFKQDFQYEGLKSHIRDGMLVTAVRGEIAARRKASSGGGAGDSAGGGAQTMRAAVDDMADRLKGLPASARCGDGDGGAEARRAALAAEFEAFRGELNGPASVQGESLLAAAEDQLRRFGPKPATLVLAIDADGASLVQRGNLFTMFGAETTTISSGVVVSYEFYEPHSGGVRSLKAAGVLSCMSGAVGLRDIHKAKEFQSRAGCF